MCRLHAPGLLRDSRASAGIRARTFPTFAISKLALSSTNMTPFPDKTAACCSSSRGGGCRPPTMPSSLERAEALAATFAADRNAAYARRAASVAVNPRSRSVCTEGPDARMPIPDTRRRRRKKIMRNVRARAAVRMGTIVPEEQTPGACFVFGLARGGRNRSRSQPLEGSPASAADWPWPRPASASDAHLPGRPTTWGGKRQQVPVGHSQQQPHPRCSLRSNNQLARQSSVPSARPSAQGKRTT